MASSEPSPLSGAHSNQRSNQSIRLPRVQWPSDFDIVSRVYARGSSILARDGSSLMPQAGPQVAAIPATPLEAQSIVIRGTGWPDCPLRLGLRGKRRFIEAVIQGYPAD